MISVDGVSVVHATGRDFVGSPQIGDVIEDANGERYAVVGVRWLETTMRTPVPRQMYERHLVLEVLR
jgi:hypothetical protein